MRDASTGAPRGTCPARADPGREHAARDGAFHSTRSISPCAHFCSSCSPVWHWVAVMPATRIASVSSPASPRAPPRARPPRPVRRHPRARKLSLRLRRLRLPRRSPARRGHPPRRPSPPPQLRHQYPRRRAPKAPPRAAIPGRRSDTGSPAAWRWICAPVRSATSDATGRAGLKRLDFGGRATRIVSCRVIRFPRSQPGLRSPAVPEISGPQHPFSVVLAHASGAAAGARRDALEPFVR